MAAQTLPPQQQYSTTSSGVMEMLRQHVPLMLFVDLAFPDGLRDVGIESCA
jgi:hypothetical protein